jgi:ribosomal protein RSM22 (predicted rRNA methylase)
MTPRTLPPLLAAARDRLLEGVSRKSLQQQATVLSQRYRSVAGGHAQASEVLAYTVTRMPATYASAIVVLDELTARLPGFAPASLLDLGSGPGTMAWAAATVFDTLTAVTSVEAEPAFRALAAQLAVDHPLLAGAETTAVNLEQHADIARRYDLVTAGFMLAEISAARLPTVIAGAWAATAGVLVLVEPGTPAGFTRLRAARTQVIAAGGHIIAPCPHAAACPIAGDDWCHFAVRLARDREHRQVKAVDAPFEDEKYAYVILGREPAAAIAGRILSPPRIGKVGVIARVCGPAGIAEKRVLSRQRAEYRIARDWRWGDAIG